MKIECTKEEWFFIELLFTNLNKKFDVDTSYDLPFFHSYVRDEQGSVCLDVYGAFTEVWKEE